MSLTIEQRQVEDVTVLACSGQITLGEATSEFRNRIRELLNQGVKKLVIDLGNVRYLDSSGIGELVGSYTSASNVGAKMKLANLTKKLHDLLSITKLITVFEVYESEEAAVASMK